MSKSLDMQNDLEIARAALVRVQNRLIELTTDPWRPPTGFIVTVKHTSSKLYGVRRIVSSGSIIECFTSDGSKAKYRDQTGVVTSDHGSIADTHVVSVVWNP